MSLNALLCPTYRSPRKIKNNNIKLPQLSSAVSCHLHKK